MKNKFLAAFMIGCVPLSMFMSRWIDWTGWTGIVTSVVLFLIWGTQFHLLMKFVRDTRTQFARKDDAVRLIMQDDAEGIALTDNVVRAETPGAQWDALDEFGQKCFDAGMAHAQYRMSGKCLPVNSDDQDASPSA